MCYSALRSSTNRCGRSLPGVVHLTACADPRLRWEAEEDAHMRIAMLMPLTVVVGCGRPSAEDHSEHLYR